MHRIFNQNRHTIFKSNSMCVFVLSFFGLTWCGLCRVCDRSSPNQSQHINTFLTKQNIIIKLIAALLMFISLFFHVFINIQHGCLFDFNSQTFSIWTVESHETSIKINLLICDGHFSFIRCSFFLFYINIFFTSFKHIFSRECLKNVKSNRLYWH